MNRSDPLRATARIAPGVTALIDDSADLHYTYHELDSRVSAVARGMQTAGVARGDRVAILGTIEAAVPIAVHACWRIGAAPATLNSDLPTDRLRNRIDRIDSSRIVRTSSVSFDGPADTVESLAEEESIPDRHLSTDTDASDVACVLFTSGTTGSASPVPLTWRNLRTNAVGSALRLGHRPDDRWSVCLEPFHMGGFAPIVRASLYGTGIILHAPSPDAMETAIRDHAASGTSLVPTMLARAIDADVPLERLRTVLVGGDRTPPDLVDRALAAEIPLYCSYGMTEAASQIATAPPAALRDAPTTVGPPLRRVRVSIVDGEGTPVDPGATGEIVVDGPTVTSGYLDESGADRFTASGAFHTGDEGYIDTDGHLFVTGRQDDRIVTGGATVDSRTVAAILENHPDVESAAVVGIPDDQWGERVGALLETQGDPETVLVDLHDSFDEAERPRAVRAVDQLPRTESGTVDRPTVQNYLTEE